MPKLEESLEEEIMFFACRIITIKESMKSLLELLQDGYDVQGQYLAIILNEYIENTKTKFDAIEDKLGVSR